MEIFEKIVTSLFKSLKIETSKIQNGQFFIELAEGLKVNVICNWEGSVILVANLGGVKDNSPKLLWNLLENNLFCELPQFKSVLPQRIRKSLYGRRSGLVSSTQVR